MDEDDLACLYWRERRENPIADVRVIAELMLWQLTDDETVGLAAAELAEPRTEFLESTSALALRKLWSYADEMETALFEEEDWPPLPE